jgi:uncharacterized membrane protein YeiH
VTLLNLLSLLGVAFFAASGTLAAGRKSLDLIGVFVIAAVTAIGGGTIRDVLLGRYPIFWIREPLNLAAIVVGTLLTLAYVRFRTPPHRLLLVADALGLALFSILGAQIAEREGLAVSVVVLMGVITGVAGGIVRDVLTAEVPLVMRRGHLYATAAIAGLAVYLLGEALGLESVIAGVIGMVVIVVLRFASIFWGLEVPVFTLAAGDHDS